MAIISDEIRETWDTGLRLCELGLLHEADNLVRLALERWPDDGRLAELQAIVWHGQEEFELARGAFETAQLLVPLSVPGQLAMADACRRLGDRESARTTLYFLAGRDGVPTQYLSALAVGLAQLGDYQRALNVCREASHREPERDEPLYGMAFYMTKLDYPLQHVLPVLERAHSLAPDCIHYRAALAIMYCRAERWTQSYQLFSALEPEQVGCLNCLRHMIHVFERVGDDARRSACVARVMAIADERRHHLHSTDVSPGAPSEPDRGET